MGMRGKNIGLAVLLGLLLAPPLTSGQAYAACPCPKARMVELYGSVSMYPPKLPGPRIVQPTARPLPLPVSMTALPSMEDVAGSLPTPVMDRITNPLLWDLLFVPQ